MPPPMGRGAAALWFKFAVVGVRPAPAGAPAKRVAAVALKRAFNAGGTAASGGGGGGGGASGGAFDVGDGPLAAFCLPLGPDAQTPKDRMAPEVGGQPGRGCRRRSRSAHAWRPAPSSHAARRAHGQRLTAARLRSPTRPTAPAAAPPTPLLHPQEFTFTLTQGDGARVQGFCRRFLPPPPPPLPRGPDDARRAGGAGGAGAAGAAGAAGGIGGPSRAGLRYPQVAVLVCEASWPALFFKVRELGAALLRGVGGGRHASHSRCAPCASRAWGTASTNRRRRRRLLMGPIVMPKVLEVAEQLLAAGDGALLGPGAPPDLPGASPAAAFLAALAEELAGRPALGSTIRRVGVTQEARSSKAPA
jgi:hypothetical protein